MKTKALEKFQKSLAVLLAVTTCMVGAVGCGAKQEEAASETSTKETTEAVQAEETKEAVQETAEAAEPEISGELNLAIFLGGYGDTYWYDMVEKFEAKYPDVTVNMNINPKIGEIIKPQIVAGDVPDFMYLNVTDDSGVVGSLIKEQALLDISDVFEETLEGDDVPLKDRILDGILGSNLTSPYGDGKIYLAPLECSPATLVYNKALFEEKGWEVPTTWDEMFELAEIAKTDTYMVGDEEVTGRALLSYPGIYPNYLRTLLFPAVAQNGGADAVTAFGHYEEGSINNEATVTYLKKFEEIAANGYLLDGCIALNHTQSQTEFLLGKALFMSSGVWLKNEMKDAPREEGFEFGMCPAPALTEGDTRYTGATCGQLSIPAKAKNPEAAKAFLKFLYSEESIKSFAENSNALYATKDASEICAGIMDEELLGMYEGAYEGSEMVIIMTDAVPQGCNVDPMVAMYRTNLNDVLGGTATIEEYVQGVEEAWAEIRESQ